MTNRLKLIGNSAYTVIAMLIISCSLCAMAWSLKQHSQWDNLAVASVLIGGIVLFAWLIWATFAIVAKKTVKEMNPKSRIIIGMLSVVLFAAWLYLATSPIVAIICVPFLVWSEFQSIQSLKAGKE